MTPDPPPPLFSGPDSDPCLSGSKWGRRKEEEYWEEEEEKEQ